MTAEARTPSGLGHAMRVLLQAVANGTMSVEAAWISVMREIDPPPRKLATCPVCGVASPGSHTIAVEHAPGCTATPLQRLLSTTSTVEDHDAEDRAFGATPDQSGDSKR